MLPQRQIQAVGAYGLFADLLRHIGRDHHVNRVANRVNANEDQRRYDQHDDDGLHQALDNKCEHGGGGGGGL